MSTDYLLAHAAKNVWCTPDQDRQYILRPARITKPLGALRTVQVLWNQYILPTATDRFHVYQIGQLYPAALNFDEVRGIWRPLSAAARSQNLWIHLYTNNGVQYPKNDAWYLIAPDKNVLIAVKDQPKLPGSLGTDSLYVHFYSNAYFGSLRQDASGLQDEIFVGGQTINVLSDITDLAATLATYRAKRGYAYGVINGIMTDRINVSNCHIGDKVEINYDSTVVNVIDLPISAMGQFDSILDSKRKYLVHHTVPTDTIRYLDDNDVFLVLKSSTAAERGLLYHRNPADAVRMVTHRDYSIVVPYVQAYVDGGLLTNNANNLTVRLLIREGGYNRPLVNEHHRIQEMYHMADADVKAAMLGIDSSMPEWRADNLENSAYPTIMADLSIESNDISNIVTAYGYNAISKIACDSPLAVSTISGTRQTLLPVALQNSSTIYEYTDTGELIGFYSYLNGQLYLPQNINTGILEGVPAIASTGFNTTFGAHTTDLSTIRVMPGEQFKYYKCPIVLGVPTEVWTDVTGTGAYTLVGDLVTWQLDPALWYTQIKGDGNFIAYNLSLDASLGPMRFSFNAKEKHNNVVSTRVLSLKPAKIDIWMNGLYMVEDIDYKLIWPQVIISNTNAVINTQHLQKITIRMIGFCNSSIAYEKNDETGFITYGVISRNNRYNIHDDRVIKAFVNGRLQMTNTLHTSERYSQLTPINAQNGQAYCITETVIPLRDLPSGFDTYTMRASSRAVDGRISDYVTLKLPEQIPTLPGFIQQPWPLCAVFMARILVAVTSGWIPSSVYINGAADSAVLAACAEFESYLLYDPFFINGLKDNQNVVIVPYHWHDSSILSLSVPQWAFILKVNTLYYTDGLQLNNFITIAP